MTTITDTLYVCRKLGNPNDLIEWAKTQNISSITPPEKMHVTVCYSKKPIKWPNPRKNVLVLEDIQTSIDWFGENNDIMVLKFESKWLKDRWSEFQDLGATWDWGDYESHITISYKMEKRDDIIPYRGKLWFGNEKFAKIDDDYKEKVIQQEIEL